jgi:hypothetical protein
MLRNHIGMMITLPEKHYDESTRVTDRPLRLMKIQGIERISFQCIYLSIPYSSIIQALNYPTIV